jgi:hypothetical protein
VRRFSSLTHAPSETRRLLRDRFSRYLPSHHNTFNRPSSIVTLPDESVLYLFQRLRIDFANDTDSARSTYEATYSAANGELNWGELLAMGWIRPAWQHCICSTRQLSSTLIASLPEA